MDLLCECVLFCRFDEILGKVSAIYVEVVGNIRQKCKTLIGFNFVLIYVNTSNNCVIYIS